MPLLLVLLAAGCAPDKVTAIEVDSGAPSADCDTRVPEDHASPVEALAAAPEGSRVCIAGGTWKGSLDFAGRDVMLVGAGVEQTILEGDGDGPVVVFQADETAAAGLSSLTVTGGVADAGAGIYVLDGANPTLSDVVLRDNTCAGLASTVRGVGIYAESGTFSDVIARGNTCLLDTGAETKLYGSGAYFRGTAGIDGVEVRENQGSAREFTGALVAKDLGPTLRGVVAWNNRAEAGLLCVGGGVHLSGSTTAAVGLDIRANRCAADSEVRGAGLHVFVDGSITIDNAVIAGNEAEAGVTVKGGGLRLSGAAALTHVDVFGNVATAPLVTGGAVGLAGPDHRWREVAVSGGVVSGDDDAAEVAGESATVDWRWCGWGADPSFGGGLVTPDEADGHVFEDPRYTDVSALDPTAWDLGLAAGSPHIDAGDPDGLDADGTRSDIGAYGGTDGGG